MRDHSELSEEDREQFRGKRLLQNMVIEVLLLHVHFDTGGEIPTLEPFSRDFKIHDPKIFTC